MFTFPSTPVGVDISDDGIKVCDLTSPSGLLTHHQRISSTATTVPARLQHTADALQKVLLRTGGVNKRFTTAVTSPTAAFHALNLPRVNDISYHLLLNGRDYVPAFNSSDCWNWIPLLSSEDQDQKILLITCPAPAIQFLRDIAMITQQKWSAIEVDMLALQRVVTTLMKSVIASVLYLTPACGIFWIFSATQIVTVSQPIIFSSKSLETEKLIAYVQQGIAATEINVKEIIVIGNISMHADLAENIQRATSITTYYGNPFEKIKKQEDIAIEIADSPKWALAYGLALRGSNEKD